MPFLQELKVMYFLLLIFSTTALWGAERQWAVQKTLPALVSKGALELWPSQLLPNISTTAKLFLHLAEKAKLKHPEAKCWLSFLYNYTGEIQWLSHFLPMFYICFWDTLQQLMKRTTKGTWTFELMLKWPICLSPDIWDWKYSQGGLWGRYRKSRCITIPAVATSIHGFTPAPYFRWASSFVFLSNLGPVPIVYFLKLWLEGNRRAF